MIEPQALWRSKVTATALMVAPAARPRLPRATIQRQATEFRIWRCGTAHEWDVTPQDIEEETGIGEKTVRTIAKQRGWPIKPGEVGRPAGLACDLLPEVDFLMRTPHRAPALFDAADES